jgi:Tfp pilus assembly protein PilO
MIILPKDWLKNLQKNKYLQLLPDLKEEKARKFITLILTLLTLSIFGIFAIGPTLSTISKLNKELKDNRLVEQQLNEKIANLSLLQGKYADLQGTLPDIYSAIPKSPEIAILMGQFGRIESSKGISIINAQTFQVEAITNTENTKKNTKNVNKKFSSFNFTLSVEGDYKNVKEFIEELSKMRRIISLDTLSISSIYDKQKGNILRLSIKGTAYFKE